MKENYKKELPENYESIKEIDAKKVKFQIFMNVFCLVLAAIVFMIGFLIIQSTKGGLTIGIDLAIALFVNIFVFIAIIIIHELIHGLFYKIFTKEKLTFGLTLSCAYCGVPKIFVYRRPMMVTCMAPCVIISLVLIILMIFIPNPNVCYVILFIASLHFGGCIGDIYVTILLLFKYRDNNILLNDTGPKQTIYCLKDETIEVK